MMEQVPNSSLVQSFRRHKTAFAKKFPQAAEWLKSGLPYTLSRLPMGLNIIFRGLVIRELNKDTVAANTLSTALQYFLVGPTTAILFTTGMKIRKYFQGEDAVGVHLVFDNGRKVAALLSLLEGFLLLTLRYSLPVVGVPRGVAKETADYFESLAPMLLPMYWLVCYQQLALATNKASVTQYSGWAYLLSSMALGYPLAFVMGIRGIAVGYYTGPLTLFALERYYLKTPAFRHYLSLNAAGQADRAAVTNYNDVSVRALTKFGFGLSSQVWTDWLRAVLASVAIANIDSKGLRASHSATLVSSTVLTVIAAPAQVTRVVGVGKNGKVVQEFKNVLRQIKQGTSTPDLSTLQMLLAEEEQFSSAGVRIATGSIMLFAVLMAGLYRQISPFGLDNADKADAAVVSLAEDMYLTSLAMLSVDVWRYMLSAAHNSTGRLYHPAIISFAWMNIAGFALGVPLALLEQQQRTNWLFIAGTVTIAGAALHLRYTLQRYFHQARQDLLQLTAGDLQVQSGNFKQPRFVEAASEVAREGVIVEEAAGARERTDAAAWCGQPNNVRSYVLFAMVIGLISEAISAATARDSAWQDVSYALKWMAVVFTTVSFMAASKMRLTFFSSGVGNNNPTQATLRTRLVVPEDGQLGIELKSTLR